MRKVQSAPVVDASQGDIVKRPDAELRLWTVREFARFLHVHEKTIYDWVSRGEVPCIRLGNRLRFLPSDVSRWLQARKEGV